MGRDVLSAAGQRAVERMKQGDRAGGLSILEEAVERTGTSPGTYEHFEALAELGSFLLHGGVPEEAEAALRRAIDCRVPGDERADSERQSSMLDLAGLLRDQRRFDEAEVLLRRSIEERLALYGAGHVRHAYALESLGDVLLLAGRHGDAVATSQAALDLLWAHGDPRLVEVLVLRAIARTADGQPGSGLDAIDCLPDEYLPRFVRAMEDWIDPRQAETLGPILDELADRVVPRLGEAHEAVGALRTQRARLGSSSGDAKVRERIFRQLLAAHDAAGRAEDAVTAGLGLALALSEADRMDEAEAAYRDAVERATFVGRPDLESQALRNLGIFLADLGRREEADPFMRRAVTRAQVTRDEDLVARNEAALGIFLMHGGHAVAARRTLEKALRVLAPTEPDAVCARLHLEAIRAGVPCSCADPRAALASSFREEVLRRLPPGILDDLAVACDEHGQLSIEARASRELTDDESRILQEVVQSAMARFRSR